MKNKNILRTALVTPLILAIPLVAMQFTQEVQWTLFDFIFAGALIFGTGLAYELVAKRSAVTAYRAAVGVALAASFLLVWINGAVGIIGDDNSANLLYGAVLLTLLIGTVGARLQPLGMMRALIATALVQALVPVVALMIWSPGVIAWTPSIAGVFMLNGGFVALYTLSALLFRHASTPNLSKPLSNLSVAR